METRTTMQSFLPLQFETAGGSQVGPPNCGLVVGPMWAHRGLHHDWGVRATAAFVVSVFHQCRSCPRSYVRECCQ
eukprot:4446926-Lingulodinium_polyedra.AAC.1